MYFATLVMPVNDPFGSSTCFIWPYYATVPTPLKGSRQEKASFLASAHRASVGGGKGDVPGVFKERKGRTRE